MKSLPSCKIFCLARLVHYAYVSLTRKQELTCWKLIGRRSWLECWRSFRLRRRCWARQRGSAVLAGPWHWLPWRRGTWVERWPGGRSETACRAVGTLWTCCRCRVHTPPSAPAQTCTVSVTVSLHRRLQHKPAQCQSQCQSRATWTHRAAPCVTLQMSRAHSTVGFSTNLHTVSVTVSLCGCRVHTPPSALSQTCTQCQSPCHSADVACTLHRRLQHKPAQCQSRATWTHRAAPCVTLQMSRAHSTVGSSTNLHTVSLWHEQLQCHPAIMSNVKNVKFFPSHMDP